MKFICICDVVDISIWTVCNAYCELSMMDVMFIWMWYVAVTESNNLVICGSFAKCYIRQKGYLPSAMKNTLGKADTWQISVYSGTKMASLPNVCAVTLGKKANICTFWASLCRVSSIWHSAKKTCLPSARNLTLGKEGRFAECQVRDTRQMRRDHLCDISFPTDKQMHPQSVLLATTPSLPSPRNYKKGVSTPAINKLPYILHTHR